MKVKVVQIVWHNKEPVFSVDFHPSGLLATGGADGEIKASSGPPASFLTNRLARNEQCACDGTYFKTCVRWLQLWKLGPEGQEAMGITFLESVTGDKFDTGLKTWNCIRFCPTGLMDSRNENNLQKTVA